MPHVNEIEIPFIISPQQEAKQVCAALDFLMEDPRVKVYLGYANNLLPYSLKCQGVSPEQCDEQAKAALVKWLNSNSKLIEAALAKHKDRCAFFWVSTYLAEKGEELKIVKERAQDFYNIKAIKENIEKNKKYFFRDWVNAGLMTLQQVKRIDRKVSSWNFRSYAEAELVMDQFLCEYPLLLHMGGPNATSRDHRNRCEIGGKAIADWQTFVSLRFPGEERTEQHKGVAEINIGDVGALKKLIDAVMLKQAREEKVTYDRTPSPLSSGDSESDEAMSVTPTSPLRELGSDAHEQVGSDAQFFGSGQISYSEVEETMERAPEEAGEDKLAKKDSEVKSEVKEVEKNSSRELEEEVERVMARGAAVAPSSVVNAGSVRPSFSPLQNLEFAKGIAIVATELYKAGLPTDAIGGIIIAAASSASSTHVPSRSHHSGQAADPTPTPPPAIAVPAPEVLLPIAALNRTPPTPPTPTRAIAVPAAPGFSAVYPPIAANPAPALAISVPASEMPSAHPPVAALNRTPTPSTPTLAIAVPAPLAPLGSPTRANSGPADGSTPASYRVLLPEQHVSHFRHGSFSHSARGKQGAAPRGGNSSAPQSGAPTRRGHGSPTDMKNPKPGGFGAVLAAGKVASLSPPIPAIPDLVTVSAMGSSPAPALPAAALSAPHAVGAAPSGLSKDEKTDSGFERTAGSIVSSPVPMGRRIDLAAISNSIEAARSVSPVSPSAMREAGKRPAKVSDKDEAVASAEASPAGSKSPRPSPRPAI